MSTTPPADLEPLEKSLLWDAVEGTYLIELRNDVKDSGLSIDAYRRRVGAAIERMLDAGLVKVSVGEWGSDESRPATREEVTSRLADTSAWDPDRADLLILDATDAGRRALGS